MLFYR